MVIIRVYSDSTLTLMKNFNDVLIIRCVLLLCKVGWTGSAHYSCTEREFQGDAAHAKVCRKERL